jgi:hypothetical protein
VSPFVRGFVEELKKNASRLNIISTSLVAPLQAKLRSAGDPELWKRILKSRGPMEMPMGR